VHVSSRCDAGALEELGPPFRAAQVLCRLTEGGASDAIQRQLSLETGDIRRWTARLSEQSAMTRHRIQRMYTIRYEVSVDPSRPLRTVPADAVASMNTQDMPPFAAFARGSDIDDRAASGLLSGDGIERAWDAQRTIMTFLTGFLRKGQWLSWTEGTDVGRRAIHARCSVRWRVYAGSSP
jgi:hypothetical protein